MARRKIRMDFIDKALFTLYGLYAVCAIGIVVTGEPRPISRHTADELKWRHSDRVIVEMVEAGKHQELQYKLSERIERSGKI